MNSETIFNWVTQNLAEREDDVDGQQYQDEQILDPEHAKTLAPTLEAKILEAIEDHEFSDMLHDTLRREMEEIAGSVIGLLPQEEATRLGQATAVAIREKSAGQAQEAPEGE